MYKILFLIHDLGYGGAERVLVNLANALDKNKYEVYVQTLFDVGINREYLSAEVHYIPGMKRVFKGNATLMKMFSPSALAKMVIKGEYDLVVSFLEGPCSRIVAGYKGKKAAWIHTIHNSSQEMAAYFKSEKEMRECYDSFDAIFCVADTVKENFQRVSKTRAKCKTLYNVNDTTDIISKSNEKQNIIRESKEYINIITCGRLINKIKGFDRLIKIHKRLLDEGIRNRLFILGEGPDKEKLDKLIIELGVESTCFLLGFQNNPYKYYKGADLFVCSSFVEGFSTAVTEALILGLPVISTDVSGAYELLGRHNEYGVVCSKEDEALFDAVKKLCSSRELLERYKKTAKERGTAFYSENAVLAVEEEIDGLLR